MEAEPSQEIDASDLKSIDRYFWVLLESYPEPVNQTELAKRAGVTRAAVSQVRDTLITICDLKSLAYERKLVLKKETKTGYTLLAYLLWASTPDNFKKYISSQYFDEIIKQSDIYNKIKENALDYNFESYFTEEDLDWVYRFIINKIVCHEPEIIGNIIVYEIKDDDYKQYFLGNLPLNIQLLYSALYETSLHFLKEESDYNKLLELRDKIWFFIIKNKKIYESLLIDTMDWLEVEEEKQREVNMEDALETILLHAIKKSLKNFTSYVYDETQKSDVEIKNKYKKLGSLFKT